MLDVTVSDHVFVIDLFVVGGTTVAFGTTRVEVSQIARVGKFELEETHCELTYYVTQTAHTLCAG